MKEVLIEGYDGQYLLYPDGRVWSNKRKRFLTAYPNVDGYMGVKLSKNCIGIKFSIHSLLAKYYIPNPLNLETVNHKDKDKLNNSLDNLEWMTREDNVKHGLQKSYVLRDPFGTTHSFIGQAEFCRNHNLTQANISKVILGERPHHKGWTLVA